MPPTAHPPAAVIAAGIPLWQGMAPQAHGTAEMDVPEIIPFLPKAGGAGDAGGGDLPRRRIWNAVHGL